MPPERGPQGLQGCHGLISQAKMLTCGVTRGLGFGFSVCQMKSSLLCIVCGVIDPMGEGWLGERRGYMGWHCPLVAAARAALHGART